MDFSVVIALLVYHLILVLLLFLDGYLGLLRHTIVVRLLFLQPLLLFFYLRLQPRKPTLLLGLHFLAEILLVVAHVVLGNAVLELGQDISELVHDPAQVASVAGLQQPPRAPLQPVVVQAEGVGLGDDGAQLLRVLAQI